MSSPPDRAAMIAQYDTLFTQGCTGLAAATFLIYDFAITFGEEIDYFWKDRVSPGSRILYIMNKYLSLLAQVIIAARLLPIFTEVSCTRIVKTQLAVDILQYLPWSAFALLRAYALSGRHWFWTTLVFALSLVSLPVNLVKFFVYNISGYEDPIFGCLAGVDVPEDEIMRGVIVSRSSLIAADVILIGLTLSNYLIGPTLSSVQSNILSIRFTRSRNLRDVIVRDGRHNILPGVASIEHPSSRLDVTIKTDLSQRWRSKQHLTVHRTMHRSHREQVSPPPPGGSHPHVAWSRYRRSPPSDGRLIQRRPKLREIHELCCIQRFSRGRWSQRIPDEVR
ncbi:hypothetical protein C8Q76DRAFT_856131 [Earliella scabrosa]|nr:hypothetical protein C8Q76DRAFT_856131 [Earliella scabrosa]